jgi:hypothetical protein
MSRQCTYLGKQNMFFMYRYTWMGTMGSRNTAANCSGDSQAGTRGPRPSANASSWAGGDGAGAAGGWARVLCHARAQTRS